MPRKSRTLVAFASALALAATGADKPANATTITETISFTASGFSNSSGTPFPAAPVDPVIGSFTITLDPTIDLQIGSTITLDNINITPSTNAPFFEYRTVQGGFLTLCSSIIAFRCGIARASNSWW